MKVKLRQTTRVGSGLRLILWPLFVVTLLAAPLLSLSAAALETTAGQAVQKSQTTVRGKLIRKVKGQERPAAYVAITLSTSDKQRRTVPVYTDAKGMFYIYTPGGQYILEIWGTQKEVVRSFYIDVPDSQYFDVAPITVP